MTHSDPPHQRPDWEALARYHAGESTPQEAAAVRDWLASHPREAARIDRMYMLVDERMTVRVPRVTDDDVERALARAHRALDNAQPVLVRSQPTAQRDRIARRSRTAWWTGGLAAAAAVAAIMLVSRPARHESTSVTQLASSVSAGQVVATAVGARDSIRLPDGTTVLLGPASRLTLSASYGRGGREVSLDGVARFAVQHDSSAPFVVRAGAAIVRDIGTVFMVRTSGGESRQPATVAVAEGAVSLASDRARATPVQLGAGDRGELRADGEVVAQRGSVGDADFAWTRGILDFNDAPMAQVRDELQRWYGVELRVDSTLATRRLTATFGREPLDEVLRTIALALGADVTRDGTVATLRAGGAPR